VDGLDDNLQFEAANSCACLSPAKSDSVTNQKLSDCADEKQAQLLAASNSTLQDDAADNHMDDDELPPASANPVINGLECLPSSSPLKFMLEAKQIVEMTPVVGERPDVAWRRRSHRSHAVDQPIGELHDFSRIFSRLYQALQQPVVSSQRSLTTNSLLKAVYLSEKKRTEQTTPFGVNLMRSQVLYQAAQDFYLLTVILQATA